MSSQARPGEPEGIAVRRYGPLALTVRLNAQMSSARLTVVPPASLVLRTRRGLL